MDSLPPEVELNGSVLAGILAASCRPSATPVPLGCCCCRCCCCCPLWRLAGPCRAASCPASLRTPCAPANRNRIGSSAAHSLTALARTETCTYSHVADQLSWHGIIAIFFLNTSRCAAPLRSSLISRCHSLLHVYSANAPLMRRRSAHALFQGDQQCEYCQKKISLGH